jgi:hypothetical protein
VVVVVGLTGKPFPDPDNVPPQEPAYHTIISPVPPPPPLRVSVVLPPLQIVVKLAVAEVGLVDFWFTVQLASVT